MGSPLILENIAKHVALSGEEQSMLLERLQRKSLRKKEYLIHEHDASRHIAFVLKGCLRSYSIDNNGFEHILQFAPPGWWITDMNSLISGQPGKLNIDALEDSDVLLLSRQDQELLFASSPKFERFFRIITENSVAAISHRLLDYMGRTAQERYLIFNSRYPGLAQSLPQKQIASYIGVTPEFLSKMKSAVLKARSD